MALSGVLAAGSVAVATWSGEVSAIFWALMIVSLIPLWYSRAVAAESWYAQAMQALVDLGRLPLADKLGLRLPGDLGAERELWQAVSDYAS